MKQNDDVLLHRRITKHSNLMIPFSDHVTAFKFPSQNEQLINTTVTLKYRDRYIADKEAYSISNSKRPKDDTLCMPPGTMKEDIGDIIFTGEFRILRADRSAPFIFIGISTNYKYIVTGKTDENGILENIYPVAMFQMSEYVGLCVTNMYFGKLDMTDAVVLASDHGEPCNAVIMEYLDDKKKQVRFVLGDECFSVLRGYLDKSFKQQKLETLDDLRNYKMNRTINECIDLRKYLLKDIVINPNMESDK